MKKKLLLLITTLLSVPMFAQTPRLSLLEEFTGENCGPCASINPGVNATLARPVNKQKVVAIKWQVPIPSAPSATWSLYQTNKTEINWRYRSTSNGGYGYNSGTGITYAPSFMFDGWKQIPGTVTSTDCAVAQSYTSAFSITMDREWDLTQSSVNLTVNIKATANFTATGNLIFRTVMVEREINFQSAPGSNGETEFHDVAIKSFPTLQGGVAMAANWVNGQTQTFTLNCPVPSYARKKEEIAFVGFIQDEGNRKVAQAVRAEKQGLGLNDAELVSMDAPSGIFCSGTIPRNLLIRNNGSTNITDFTITPYVDNVAQTPVTWSGQLSNGAYKSFTLTPVVPAGAGGHSLSCKITGVSGGDSNLSNNDFTITFYAGTGSTGTAVAEGFPNSFPPSGWGILNPDKATTWTKSPAAGGFNLSSESAFYLGIFNERGDVDELLLPPLDLSGNADPDISFDVAYARRYYRSDTLEVLASSDCGTTWALVYRKQDSILSTTQYPMASSFTPSATQWRKESFTLPGFNKTDVLVKFRVKNDAGNNIYLDNVNLLQSQPITTTVAVGINAPILEKTTYSIYPNPTNGRVYVAVNGNAASATILLYSAGGQELLRQSTMLNKGLSTLEFDLDTFPPGLYLLTITTERDTVVRKLSINH